MKTEQEMYAEKVKELDAVKTELAAKKAESHKAREEVQNFDNIILPYKVRSS